MMDVLAALLEREPAPLTQYLPEAPAELQRIVARALHKEREERYQHVRDLLHDLKELKQELELVDKLARANQRAAQSGETGVKNSGHAVLETVQTETVSTREAS